jgi:hypothetical protein
VPRLLAVRAAARAFNGVDAMPPSLRHEAAHPLVAWPVQLTAYAAAASEIVFFFVAYPATTGSSFAMVTGLGLAGVVTWRWLARRHARLAADVIVPRRRIRLIRGAAAVTRLGLAAVAMGLLALVVTAPPANAQDDAGRFTPTARLASLTFAAKSTVDAGESSVDRPRAGPTGRAGPQRLGQASSVR